MRVSAYLRLRLPLRVCACNAVRSPYDVAPQFATDFNGSAGQAPRTPNWNVGREGKHWLVGQHHVMKEGEILFRCAKTPSTIYQEKLPPIICQDRLGTNSTQASRPTKGRGFSQRFDVSSAVDDAGVAG